MKWGYLQVALGLHYSPKAIQAILRSWIFDPPPLNPQNRFFFLWGVADDIKEIFQGGSIFFGLISRLVKKKQIKKSFFIPFLAILGFKG